MQRRAFLVVAPAALAAACATLEPAAPRNYPSLVLSPSALRQYPDERASVDAILASDGFTGRDVVVELVAGWCKPCERQAPKMDAALAALAERGAPIARLTIYYEGQRRSVAGYRSVVKSIMRTKGFPEVQIWRDGAPLPTFLGGSRDQVAIEKFLNEHLRPARTAAT